MRRSNFRWRGLLAGLWLAGSGLLVASCDPSQCPPCSTPDLGKPTADRGGPARDGKVGGDGNVVAKRYLIQLTGTHSHIYKTVALLWEVRDPDSCIDPSDSKTCQGISGLPVVAISRVPGGAEIEQKLEKGKLEDGGDGTYTLTRDFGWFGSYMVGLKFVKDGVTHFAAFPYETSRGGGEKYFCDTDKNGTDDHAFMIRWNGSRELYLADDTTEYAFTIELSRSFNTPINTKEPWKNTFDLLPPKLLTGGLPSVRLMADQGTAATQVATLTPLYKGKGLYEVKRKFTAADLGGQAARIFWLEVSFTDDLGCTAQGSMDPEEYYFPVSAKK